MAAKRKSRKQKAAIYDQKYGHIPRDYTERIDYLYDLFNLENNPDKIQRIIDKRNAMLMNMQYYDLNIVSLYEDPEGTPRPRTRVINRKNFHMEALANGQFVQVYTLGAAEDRMFMKQLVDGELIALEGLINTPVIITFNCYFKTPTWLNDEDTVLAEIGIIRPDPLRPDWDNCGKKYSDMYNGNVWIDDGTVIEGTVKKFYSILPRVEIQLRYLNCTYTQNQYKRILSSKYYDGTPLQYLDKKGELQ